MTTDVRVPAIALLVACDGRRARLSEALQRFGYQIVFEVAPAKLAAGQLAGVITDLWRLDMVEDSPLVDWLLDNSEVPVLLGNDDIPAQQDEDYPRWQRRLYAKLGQLIGSPPTVPELQRLNVSPPRSPCSVWLLGASLGGPAAVKGFLDALPAQLPIAFVYAQHIDAGFEHQLPRILGRENEWRVRNCEEGIRLQAGDVLVAPIARSMRFGVDGQIFLQDQPWPGAYQPAIETLLDEITTAFAPQCGAIIFSGMGEDGVAACGRMRHKGMQVWTQSADSAACATMPQAVQEAGFSSRQGSPEELASAMRRWIEQERQVLA